MKSKKAVVVGGGLGGLAASILLAEKGFRSTLLERAGELGGRGRSVDAHGARLNFGPHAVYRGGHAERVLAKLGGIPAGAPPKPKGFAMMGDTLHTLPTGPISLLSTGLLDLGSRIEAIRYFAKLGRLRANAGESVGEWLARNVEHERARDLLRMYFRIATYTNPTDDLLAADALSQLAMAAGPGVVYLDGGWQTMVDALVARAREAGVAIVEGAKVVRVGTAGGIVTHVETATGHVEACDALVLAVGPKVASRLLPEDTSLAARVARLRPVEAACLDVVTGPLVVAATSLFGVDSPYYAVVHSATAALVPTGKNVIHVAKYLAPDEGATEGELRALLERLQPGIAIEHAQYLPRITVTNARTSAAEGGVAGRIEGSSIPNVALVGDWVGGRGMLLDAVMASAEAGVESLTATRAEPLAIAKAVARDARAASA